MLEKIAMNYTTNDILQKLSREYGYNLYIQLPSEKSAKLRSKVISSFDVNGGSSQFHNHGDKYNHVGWSYFS